MAEERTSDVRTDMVCACEVEKVYDGKSVIERVSMTLPKGGIHGILGPRGAGKTTLMEILAGCIFADAGRIEIGGKIMSPDAIGVKQKVGYLPQRLPLCGDMTAGELLNFVGQTRRVESNKRYRQIKEALDLTGLDEIQNRLAANLTDHEARKLFLAAALLGNPDVLILDEPFGVRSAEQRAELESLVRMLGGIKTVVLATRDFATARSLCEDVIILSDGRQLAAGTFDELEGKLAESTEALSLEELYRSLSVAPSPSSETDSDGNTGKEAQA